MSRSACPPRSADVQPAAETEVWRDELRRHPSTPTRLPHGPAGARPGPPLGRPGQRVGRRAGRRTGPRPGERCDRTDAHRSDRGAGGRARSPPAGAGRSRHPDRSPVDGAAARRGGPPRRSPVLGLAGTAAPVVGRDALPDAVRGGAAPPGRPGGGTSPAGRGQDDRLRQPQGRGGQDPRDAAGRGDLRHRPRRLRGGLGQQRDPRHPGPAGPHRCAGDDGVGPARRRRALRVGRGLRRRARRVRARPGGGAVRPAGLGRGPLADGEHRAGGVHPHPSRAGPLLPPSLRGHRQQRPRAQLAGRDGGRRPAGGVQHLRARPRLLGLLDARLPRGRRSRRPGRQRRDRAVRELPPPGPRGARGPRRALRCRTRAVHEIPYDRALGAGEQIPYGELAPATREAWLQACAIMASGL